MIFFEDFRFCRFLFNERMDVEKIKKYDDFLQGFSRLEKSKKKYHNVFRKQRKIHSDYQAMGVDSDDSISLLSYNLYQTFLSVLNDKKLFIHAYFAAFVSASYLLVKSLVKFLFTDRRVIKLPSYKYIDLVFGFPKGAFSYKPEDNICDSFANMWMRTNSVNSKIISIDEYGERHLGDMSECLHENQINRILTVKSIGMNFRAAKYLIPTFSAILSLSISRVIHVRFLIETFRIHYFINKFKPRNVYFLLSSYPVGYCQCLTGERNRIVFFSYSVNFFEIPLAWVYGEGDSDKKNVTPECWGISGNIIGNIKPIKKIREIDISKKRCYYLENMPDYYSFPLQLGYISSRSFDPSTARKKPVILVFSARPVEDVVAKKYLLYGHPYLTLDLQIKYITDIVETARALGCFVVVKNKRFGPFDEFYQIIKELPSVYNNVFIEAEYTKMSELFAIAAASLSFPFSTTKYVGEHFGVPSQFYVPEVARCDGFGQAIIGVSELEEWLKINVNVKFSYNTSSKKITHFKKVC